MRAPITRWVTSARSSPVTAQPWKGNTLMNDGGLDVGVDA